jgi:hypothetical protein
MERYFRTELNELSHADDTKEAQRRIHEHINAGQDGIARVLTTNQIARLRQILLQVNGPCSVLEDQKLSAALQITNKQKSKIENICSEWTRKVRKVPPERDKTNNKEESIREKIRKERKKMQQELDRLNKNILDLFLEEQKTIYKKTLGRRLKLQPLEIKP